MNNMEYDIVFFALVIVSILLYTIVLCIGYIRAVRETREERKEERKVMHSVKNFLEEIKTIIEKGEDNMTEFKTDGTIKLDVEKAGTFYMPLIKPEIKNHMTLTDLVTRKPTDGDYNEVVNLLTELARKTYEDYKFLIIKSPNETQDYNFVQLVSKYEDDPYLHKLLFSKGIDYGLDMQELSKRFAKHAQTGNVIPLGEDVLILADDGTGQSPTGVSPITSGMEGSDIAFIIGFIQKKNFDDWQKNNFPQEDEK